MLVPRRLVAPMTCRGGLWHHREPKRFQSVASSSKGIGAANGVGTADLIAQVEDLKKRIKAMEENAALNALVGFYSSRPRPPMDLRSAVKYCQDPNYHTDIFCHKVLPVILAHNIRALDKLPLGLCAMPSILKVRQMYLETFNELITCDLPTTDEKKQQFRDIVMSIEEKRSEADILHCMAVGVLELREQLFRHRNALVAMKRHGQWKGMALPSELAQYASIMSIQEPLDTCNLFMVEYNFVSRMLLNLDKSNFSTRVGMVDVNLNLERVVRYAVDDAKQICTEHYGDCPDVIFQVRMGVPKNAFAHMSSTIRYIVIEMVKNSFRATVEAHMERNACGIVTCENMPPVRILVNYKEGAKHACICISDEGLGMTQQTLKLAMAYSYTSTNKADTSLEEEGECLEDNDEQVGPTPLAGYGYGLPMSRLYARAFNGDLILQTLEGYGTKAYFYVEV